MFDDQDPDRRLTIGVMAANGYFDPTPIPTEILAARGDRLVRIHTLLFDRLDAPFDDPDDFDDAAAT